MKALDHCDGFRVYNLGESETTTLSELVAQIENAVGKKAVLDRRSTQPGDVETTYADIARAREEIGYAPKTKVAEGVPRFVAWYRERKA